MSDSAKVFFKNIDEMFGESIQKTASTEAERQSKRIAHLEWELARVSQLWRQERKGRQRLKNHIKVLEFYFEEVVGS